MNLGVYEENPIKLWLRAGVHFRFFFQILEKSDLKELSTYLEECKWLL